MLTDAGKRWSLPSVLNAICGSRTGCGDLRVGLPFAMVDQHEPMRLQVIVEARPDLVERMLAANPRASRLFTRGYMHLTALHSGQAFPITGQKDNWAKR